MTRAYRQTGQVTRGAGGVETARARSAAARCLDDLLTLGEAAKVARCSADGLRHAVRVGDLPRVLDDGGKLRFDPDDVTTWARVLRLRLVE